ncbi:hypothetical protein UP10_12775 [Bradyrhizobium sp. LTSPM299]|nr:hypothetical protein UP10_12775 [Bradyrhizobium sp. LTSPM299]
MIEGTAAEAEYLGSHALLEEQRRVRWRTGKTKQEFWANYWCGKDSRCTCRIEGSKGLETDAIFFLRSRSNRVLAVHVEFKHAFEAFKYGQPESYPLRASCFAKNTPPKINPHSDWTTVLFCGEDMLSDERVSNFQRVITHDEAAVVISGYPR